MRQSSRFIALLSLSCCLLLASAVGASAKPRKKAKKHKETSQQKAERQRREAIQWAVLNQISIQRTDTSDGGFTVNAGNGSSVRGNSTASTVGSAGNAFFVGDPEAPNPLAPNATATAGQIIISEFRLRGPSGANDEFIELYNNSGAAHTVAAAVTVPASTGYGVYASDDLITPRCSIPNGTVIPNRGHYLCVNLVGYSLTNYPAGNGTTATGDATYVIDIPDNAGIALFSGNSTTAAILANRIDAVGSTSEANVLFKEGTGYPALAPSSIDYSYYRDTCGKSGSITTGGLCTVETPKDTDNNATDFIFVDTNGSSAGAGQRLGAPGPENLSSPILRNSTIGNALLDASVNKANAPNQVRDFTPDPPNNSTFGTLDIRRRFINNTGANITRLRFRVVDITTFPAPSGFADLRPRTSPLVVVAGVNDAATCLASNGVATTPCSVNVQGTTLEQPPNQPNGTGFNGTLSAGTITLGTPLATGASINIRFLMGIQQTGIFKLFLNVEAIP